MPPAPKWGNFPLGEHCRFILHLLFFEISNFGSASCFCFCVCICFLGLLLAQVYCFSCRVSHS
ncbi:uncharacterized protein BO88DRAFT_218470 [Aspergillus vadensis CBS 113365]|uniref:Uncharacterized protein n=1 Tax=Aspergillus vadensis (strain CBS 113365 / IMI 142717 / IBT 24658) TaxID=1448311 RepID=A0A319BJP1_ASPVC|nr:hypothetical protein BO88DRAFT_218470 [Aspergillus vadensis CBS 113365]PYH63508.1 hypothetical protein BO88DRAFT_218470 [Aspergillus vadensis CBS 113365]